MKILTICFEVGDIRNTLAYFCSSLERAFRNPSTYLLGGLHVCHALGAGSPCSIPNGVTLLAHHQY
ncbi:MAG: hypothetical protein IIX00_01425, partial [Tidjanibacter sp.]|nr:hypothetical protein [Tidjanibacter sp.]